MTSRKAHWRAEKSGRDLSGAERYELLTASLASLDPEIVAGYRRQSSRTLAVTASPERWNPFRTLWPRLTASVEVTDQKVEEERNEPNKKTSANEVKKWVHACLDLIANGVAKERYVFGEDLPDPKEGRGERDSQATSLVTLEVKHYDIDGYIDLRGIICPQLTVNVVECCLDQIEFSKSSLHSVCLHNLKTLTYPGVVVLASDCTLVGSLELSAEAADPREKNLSPEYAYMHVGAHGLSAGSVEIWNIAFLGGHYLQYLKTDLFLQSVEKVDNQQKPDERRDKEIAEEAYRAWFAECSRSIDLSHAQLGSFVAFRCFFSSIVSFRFARVETLLKCEECAFVGYSLLAPNSGKDNPLFDWFDYDDIRVGATSIQGLTLDLSRSTNEGEFVLKGIDLAHRSIEKIATLPLDPSERLVSSGKSKVTFGSRGWMNLAHSKIRLLNVDFYHWKTRSSNLVHRITGLRYDAISVPSVGDIRSLYDAAQLNSEKPTTKNLARTGTVKFAPQNQTQSQYRPGTNSQRSGPKGKDEGQSPGLTWRDVRSWLEAQLPDDLGKNFAAQPWTMAARAFDSSGDYEQANELLRMREWYWHQSLWHRKQSLWTQAFKSKLFWVLHWFNWMHGYGYRTWVPIALLAVTAFAGGLFYKAEFKDGYFLPNPDTGGTSAINSMGASLDRGVSGAIRMAKPDDIVSTGEQAAANVASSEAPDLIREARALVDYPKFNPWIYSIDVMIPVIHFSQEEYWVPGYRTVGAEQGDIEPVWGVEGPGARLQRLWIVYWIQIVIGYGLTAVTGLGLAGYFERKPPT